jgi:hypothetical protein
MAYNGIAWPGLTLSLKAVTAERNKVARWIKTGEDKPGCYIRHKQAMTKYRAMLADLDTGLQILRSAQKATERPKRRKRQENKVVEPNGC